MVFRNVVVHRSSQKMTQWSMRISAYAERLLQGNDIDWSESIKEST
jgi:leucyl-tRNA synthetase